MLCQEEATRERGRANELDMAVTNSNFKLQDLAQQLDAQTAVARQVPILKDENLRLADSETQLRVTKTQLAECEAANHGLRSQITALDEALNAARTESMEKDAAIRQIDLDVQDIQGQLETQEKAKQILIAENDSLRRDIETLQGEHEKARQL